MPRLAWLLAFALAVGRADTPATLENTGKPMRVPMVCPRDDFQALGLVCAEDEPCPLYVELNAVESTGAHLFIAGNIHTSTATLSSLLLGSSDGGKTWTEAHPRIRFASLEHIQFLDLANGCTSARRIHILPR